jgi:hypothetical protein
MHSLASCLDIGAIPETTNFRNPILPVDSE